MEIKRTSQEARLEKRRARSKTARKWARLFQVGFVALCLTAVWQERALAPKLHDRMLATADYALELLEAEGAQSYLTAMTSFQGNGNQSEFGPITEALLKLRQ